MQNSVIFVNKNLKIKVLKIKNIVKLGTVVIILVNTGVLHIAYSVHKEIPIVFCNGSDYD